MKAVVYLDPERNVRAVTVDGVVADEVYVSNIDGEPDLKLAIEQERNEFAGRSAKPGA